MVSSSFSCFFFFPRLISAFADWTSTILPHMVCGLSASLQCMSEMCCTQLAGNTERKNDAKHRHLRTIGQLCRAVSSQLRRISTISKACYYHIRQLRCIRPYLDSTTARTIATSIVHSKLDYCNSFYYNLPKSQNTSLRQIQNSLARVVVKTPKCCHITPILHSLHRLKTTERIEYKLLSLTYKVLTTTQPPYLHNLISV